MSEIYFRFFRVTDGPIMDRAREIKAANVEARKVIIAFSDEIGATNWWQNRDGGVIGFSFEQPDEKIWRETRWGYLPRKSTKIGKELYRRIMLLPAMTPVSSAFTVSGLIMRAPVVIEGNVGHYVTASGSPKIGVMFARVPWRDIDPAELDQYRADQKDGNGWSLCLQHLIWEPAPEMRMVELKEWEALKEIDEINAQQKSKKEMNK